MEVQTILLLIGALFLFIGIFGGGFEIKEIKVPRVNTVSRVLGFVVGAVFILASRGLLSSQLLEALGGDIKPANDISSPASPVSAPSEVIHDHENDAFREYRTLMRKWDDPSIENEEIRKQFEELRKNQATHLDTVEIQDINRIIDSLTESIDSFKALEEKDKSPTLTVTEKQRLWDNPKIERLSARDKEKIQKQINDYKTMIAEWASIKNPEENFITCRNVKNLNPVHPSKQFNDIVYVWARVNAPEAESLRWQFVDLARNKVVHTKYPVKVKKNLGDGYRTHYWKTFKPGIYEVRLFNSQDQLIGRREFQVGQLTSSSF